MKLRAIAAGMATAGLLFSAGAMANNHEDLHGWLEDYGFNHVTEVEWKSNDRVEVEGFARDNMRSEVVFGADGSVQSEDHERHARDAWGLDLSQLQAAMEEGKDGGIRRFDEIDINSRGEVKVEGYDENGRDVELRFSRDDL